MGRQCLFYSGEMSLRSLSNGRARKRAVVTSIGVVSPFGIGSEVTLDALRGGKDCIGPVDIFDVSGCRCRTAGQVREMPPAGFSSRAEKRLHRASLMMISALREVLQHDPEFLPELAVIGTTSGGMSFGEAFHKAILDNGSKKGRAGWLANYAPQKPVLDALEVCRTAAPIQIIANACASGTNAVGHASALIRSGQHRRVLCGGYDALSQLVFVGFDSLQAATPEKCRPFDAQRTGLVLGEGAALLAIEELESARARRAPILAEITGYGVSTDNHHLTQPHPSGIGPRMAMERALASAGRSTDAVSYINAHGTATQFNDATEGAAIMELMSGVPVSSTKSMMGHSLGAAGAIEAVISILALQHQFLPPNINFVSAAPEAELNVVANEAREADVECVLSNSFGFGGTNATIVLERAA
jgi:3-oxoacyl-[acyl-carrier-protein] synthase II